MGRVIARLRGVFLPVGGRGSTKRVVLKSWRPISEIASDSGQARRTWSKV